jgi:hypothetical protein
LRFRSPCMPRHCDAARRPMATVPCGRSAVGALDGLKPLWSLCEPSSRTPTSRC